MLGINNRGFVQKQKSVITVPYVGKEVLETGNPYWGHVQTVQTKFRHRRTRCPIRVSTVCLQEFLRKMKKCHLETPKFRNGLIQIIRTDKSTGTCRDKHCGFSLSGQSGTMYLRMYFDRNIFWDPNCSHI